MANLPEQTQNVENCPFWCKPSSQGRRLFWQTSLPVDAERYEKLQAGQSYLHPWEENAANLPEHHFWTCEGDEGDEMTGSVSKEMEVDVIYPNFSKAFITTSQSIFWFCLGRYDLHAWKTSWVPASKNKMSKG